MNAKSKAAPRRPARTGTGALSVAWAGGVLYALAVLLLLFGAPRLSGTVQAIGSVLAVGLLAGVLRQAPVTALVLTLFGSTAVVLLSRDFGGPGRFLAFLAVDVALAGVAVGRSRRVVIAAAVPVGLVQVLMAFGFGGGPDQQIGTAVIAVLALATAGLFSLLVRERREHAVELRGQEVAEAVTAERLRIARELHDMVAHSIGIIAIQAGVGSRVIETQPAEAAAALRAIEQTGRETLAGLRRTLVALRRADPDAGSGPSASEPAPGLADLERLAAATADAGVRVSLEVTGERRALPPEIELSAYRIVQEALTNVVRHAATGQCRVAVGYGDEELVVEVVDDGRGAVGDATGHGFGLVGMRERAGLLHGSLSAGPREGGGFRVLARLPLPSSAPVAAVAG
ncbi:sensor histidine kinase [Kitasatospora sp. NPDC002040]|uniref:sensor histidine kinase n=1 Tax=Kitasatospora sp. NPDC002040 TaxID=3154661 RepID=UPI0033256DCC